jgi:acyl dehydratase
VTAAGTALPDWTLGAVDPERMKALALLLGDPNPLHLDRDAAVRAGFADRVSQGPANLAMLLNLVRQAFPAGRITRYQVRLAGAVLAGQAVRATGKVAARRSAAAGELLTCAVELHAGDGVAMHGEVDVVLPDAGDAAGPRRRGQPA